jgi:hypothetical protein
MCCSLGDRAAGNSVRPLDQAMESRWELSYEHRMTKEQVKEILDRVLTWPADRQADVAEVVRLMEAQDKSALSLSDEQAAEVRRRLAEQDAETLTLAEFNERLRRRYGA